MALRLLTIQCIYRGKDNANRSLQCDEGIGYGYLSWYLEAVKRTNHGSSCVLDIQDGRFRRLFIAYGASIHGFQYCHPILFVDGTFINNKYKGMFLGAFAKTGNTCMINFGYLLCVVAAISVTAISVTIAIFIYLFLVSLYFANIFPYAFTIVDAESKENWRWFFEELAIILISNHRNIVFMMDRGLGLLDGIKEVFPSSPHSYCIKHLKDNLFGRLSKKLTTSYRDTLVFLFAACAYTRTGEKFDEAMQKLKSDGKGVVEDFLKELKLENYAFAHFPGKRYGAMSNSQAESYNNMIKDERCMPLPQLLEAVRVHTMDLFTRRLDSSNWGSVLCPKMEKKLLKRLHTGRNWMVSHSSQDVFEVFTETCNVMVNLARCECSCGHWEFRCFPCAHVVQVMNKVNLLAYDYIEDYWKTTFYKKSF
ncbi:hypothetical protein ACLB2K_073418 [Fragaria x ananassa]